MHGRGMSTSATEPARFDDVEALVDAILARVGRRLVVGLPLGIGKPVPIANALYRRAQKDPRIDLTFLTALTLSRPATGTDLKGRFLGPMLDRCFDGYPELAYTAPRRTGELPANVRVIEFFFSPGDLLGSPVAQRDYASVNYTHVARMALGSGLNVILQLVAESPRGISLGSNPDVTLDLLEPLRTRDAPSMVVGQIHDEMPAMGHDAMLPPATFDALLAQDAAPFALPSMPDRPISTAAHHIGLHASALVRDGGTLQLGIGELADATSRALLLRQRQNGVYRALLAGSAGRVLYDTLGGLGPFDTGVLGVTEMLVEGFLDLIDAGVVRRPAADGALVHAAFFLGPRRMLRRLREMDDVDRDRIRMAPVSFVNDVYRGFPDKAADRKDARFLNSAMMVTLDGAVIADGLADGRTVSGVGGQYNFVAMAHALPDARSAILLPATRHRDGALTSNIRTSYGHQTIPRHLRDLVVTEYGVADLRDRPTQEVAEALIAISDVRVQDELVRDAKERGTLAPGYRVPDHARRNHPDALERALAPVRDHFPTIPPESDWTETERALFRALRTIEAHPLPNKDDLSATLAPPAAATPFLKRMGLDAPRHVREHLQARALVYGLSVSKVV